MEMVRQGGAAWGAGARGARVRRRRTEGEEERKLPDLDLDHARRACGDARELLHFRH